MSLVSSASSLLLHCSGFEFFGHLFDGVAECWAGHDGLVSHNVFEDFVLVVFGRFLEHPALSPLDVFVLIGEERIGYLKDVV